ncbi:hypothetical protein M3A13_27480, partial [Klebsiella pneumoniae]|nr:hypothetical protein [Klebsiella pneumoniae]
ITECDGCNATATIAPSYFHADPISGGSGSASAPPARSGPETQDVAVFSAGNDPICCGTPLSRYRPLTTGNAHFACSVTVVHFLKRLYYGKVGSNRNGRPVI